MVTRNLKIFFVLAVLSLRVTSTIGNVKLTCGENLARKCIILIGNALNLTVSQVKLSSYPTNFQFIYLVGHDVQKEPTKNGFLLFPPLPPQTLAGNETKNVLIDTAKGNRSAGEVHLGLNDSEKNTRTQVVEISIIRSEWLETLGAVVGWMYFACWALCGYPQFWINFKRKSVVGLNFDFLTLNEIGFFAYVIYNTCLKYNYHVRELYFQAHPLGVIQVEDNDVVVAIHALFITTLTISQCFMYKRGKQHISVLCKSLTLATFLTALTTLILAVVSVISWLDYIYVWSYIKLTVSILKYIPQVYMNFRRKSTDGWSIGTVLLDTSGGLLSVLQMFLKSYNYDDWKSIFGNFTKFGLGLITISFNFCFILQHYVFYRRVSVINPYDNLE